MPENMSLAVVTRFVDALYHCGIRQVCISPGSRSTPLTMAFARHGEFRIWSLLDERSAGFFAIGAARGTHEPVVLVCTSGTAVGNFLPAAMEAHNARLPLLFITADRPPELHGVGANQTVQQQGVYGGFPGLSLQMPVPTEGEAFIRHAESVTLRVAAFLSRRSGPVHINWPFREPLIPPSPADTTIPIRRSFVSSAPALPEDSEVDRLAHEFQQVERGLIVAGPLQGRAFAPAVIQLAENLGWPIVADALSGLRSSVVEEAADVVIDGADAFLRSPLVQRRLVPDIVLRLGGTPTSKALGQYLAGLTSSRNIVVDEHNQWNDAFFTATDLIMSDETAFCNAISRREAGRRTASDWLTLWQNLNTETRHVIDAFMEDDAWFEGAIYEPLLDALPAGANLFIGNSMPVRDLETLYRHQSKPLSVLANRGVSGIDGVMSSACGAAAASNRPTALVVGDVSFYHDLNALLLPARTGADLLVVVPNNDGGGIFSFLPQASYPETFEHFQTAHGLTYEHAARQFGAWYAKEQSLADYREALAQAMPMSGLRIIELTFSVGQNIDLHRALFERVLERTEALFT